MRILLTGIAVGPSYEDLKREIVDAFTKHHLKPPRQGHFTLNRDPKRVGQLWHTCLEARLDEEVADVDALGQLLGSILNKHVSDRPHEYAPEIARTTVEILIRGEKKFSASTPRIPI